MSTYFMDVNLPIKLYHMNVDISNTNLMEGMLTYHKDVNIRNK